MRTVGAQAASPPRSPSNPPAASGGAPCEGNSQELQACHVECGTGMVSSQDWTQDAGACYPPPKHPMPASLLLSPALGIQRDRPPCMAVREAFQSKRPWK